MPFIHEKWEPRGQTLIEVDAESQPTGSKVYKASVGQECTPDGSGGFAPFIMGVAGLQFGNDEQGIDFLPDRQTLRKAADTICSSFKFFVQANVGGEWVDQPHGAPVRNMRAGEVFRGDGWVPQERRATGFLSFPDANLSFGGQKPYDLFVAIEAGGTANAGMGIRFRGPSSGQVRFQVVLDGLQRLPTDWEWIEQAGGILQDGEVRRVGIRVKDLIWMWNYEEAPLRDVSAETNPDDTKRITITIGPFDYTKNEWLTVYPDTWGATAVSDACFEVVVYGQGGPDSSGSGNPPYAITCGHSSTYQEMDAGFIWRNITIPAGSTIGSGSFITIYGDYPTHNYWSVGTGIDGDLQVADTTNPTAWGTTSNLPSDLTYHGTEVAWDLDQPNLASENSPELATMLQQRWDDDHASGDDIAIRWQNNQLSGVSNIQAMGSENASSLANPPAITIVYTAPSSGYTLTADGGTYAVSGTSAGIRYDRLLAAGAGSFGLSGTSADLLRGLVVQAGAGSYVLTGTTANFLRNFAIQAEAGSYTLTGTDLDLLRDYILSVGDGSYSLVGSEAELLHGLVLSAGGGLYAITGSDADLLRALRLSSGGGEYALTGTAVDFYHALRLAADGGSYALTGADVAFIRSIIMSAESGSFALSGSDVTLTYDSLTGYTLTAEGDTFTISGTAAELLRGLRIGADSGAFTLTGTNAALLRKLLVAANAGSYVLSGSDIGFLRGYNIIAESGSYVLTGTKTDLLRYLLLSAGAGSFSLTGSDVTLTYTPAGAYTLPAGSGSFLLSGSNVDLLRDLTLSAEGGAFTLTGSAAALLFGHILSAVGGSYVLTGSDATLTYTPAGAYILTCDVGSFALSGAGVSLLRDYVLPVDPGSYSVSGTDTALLIGHLLAASGGTFTLTGADTNFLRGYNLICDGGTYTLTGASVTLTYSGFVLPSGVVTITFSVKHPEVSFFAKQPMVSFSAKQPTILFTTN